MFPCSFQIRAISRLAMLTCVTLTSPVLIAEPPTFTKDVLPILQEKCQECHRPGQVGPMSLLSYEQTRPWAKAIQREVASRRMPPFHASGPIGHWKDDLRLTDNEIQTIIGWVESGTPRGTPSDAPPPLDWPDSTWPHGEPDLIIELPEHKIAYNGQDDLVTMFSEYSFSDLRWIRGATLQFTHKDALHHAHIFFVPESYETPPENIIPSAINTLEFPHLYTWFPGNSQELLPEKFGFSIEKGWRVGIVAHFAPQSEPKTEQLRLGVYWANGIIENREQAVGVMMFDIRIPPHDSNYTFRKANPFNEDGWITHFQAHMHLRGKSVSYTLHYPDGTSEVVFDLPRYDFHWQRNYYLEEPIWAPKGTRFEAVATWDNSSDNPDNPDPSKMVEWGPNTTDEMFGGTVHYTPDAKLDSPVHVKNGRIIRQSGTQKTTAD